MEATETVVNILAQGKRNMVCGEIPTAVNQFQEACQLLSKTYGETAKECADAYFCYGQALLELARMENGVLGNALQGVSDTDDDIPEQKDDEFQKVEIEEQDHEKLRFEVYDAMAEKEVEKSEKDHEKISEGTVGTNAVDEVDGDSTLKTNVKVDEEIGVKENSEKTLEQSGGDAKTDSDEKENKELDQKLEKEAEADKDDSKDVEMTVAEKNEEENVAEGGGTEEKENAEEVDGVEEDGEIEEEANAREESTSRDGSQDEENADDVSNLQLAWEMLELAKLIYLKDESKESQLRAAESHLKLGEISLETEQYEVALKDLSQCLEIQKTYLEPDNRLLAETYYQLGLAYCFNKQFTESTDSYTSAIKVIEERIMNLDKILATATDEEKDSKDCNIPIYKAKKEVIELKEVLPDIKAKLEDVEDEKKNLDEIINIAKQTMSGSSSAIMEVSPSEVQATDISHLVKRKRTSENILEDENPKKLKQDESGGKAVDHVLTEKRKSEDITPEVSTKKSRLDIGDGGNVLDIELKEKSKSEVTAEESSANKVHVQEGAGDAMNVELTEKNIPEGADENVAMKAKQENCDSDVMEKESKECISEENAVTTRSDNGDEECEIKDAAEDKDTRLADVDGAIGEKHITEKTKCDVSHEVRQRNIGEGDSLDNGLVDEPVSAMETQS